MISLPSFCHVYEGVEELVEGVHVSITVSPTVGVDVGEVNVGF